MTLESKEFFFSNIHQYVAKTHKLWITRSMVFLVFIYAVKKVKINRKIPVNFLIKSIDYSLHMLCCSCQVNTIKYNMFLYITITSVDIIFLMT